MSIQHHPLRQARKFCRRCQGLPIIQQCLNNVDSHLSCVGDQAAFMRLAAEKHKASFFGTEKVLFKHQGNRTERKRVMPAKWNQNK